MTEQASSAGLRIAQCVIAHPGHLRFVPCCTSGDFLMKRTERFGLFAIVAAIVAYAVSLGFFSS